MSFVILIVAFRSGRSSTSHLLSRVSKFVNIQNIWWHHSEYNQGDIWTVPFQKAEPPSGMEQSRYFWVFVAMLHSYFILPYCTNKIHPLLCCSRLLWAWQCPRPILLTIVIRKVWGTWTWGGIVTHYMAQASNLYCDECQATRRSRMNSWRCLIRVRV